MVEQHHITVVDEGLVEGARKATVDYSALPGVERSWVADSDLHMLKTDRERETFHLLKKLEKDPLLRQVLIEYRLAGAVDDYNYKPPNYRGAGWFREGPKADLLVPVSGTYDWLLAMDAAGAGRNTIRLYRVEEVEVTSTYKCMPLDKQEERVYFFSFVDPKTLERAVKTAITDKNTRLSEKKNR